MSTAPVCYTICPARPQAHVFGVSCRIEQPDRLGQRVSMPAWIPGSYMIRDFARNVISIRAESEGQPVTISKVDSSTWQCAPCEGPLMIDYEVYGRDLSVRTAHLDTHHAFFNGTSVFLIVHGQEASPCRVDIQSPPGKGHDWRVATTLPRAGAAAYGFGQYEAANYDELIDHPVEMGDFTLATFEAGGIPHDIVLTGHHRADMTRLCQDLQKICTTHIALFGKLPAIPRYLFLVQVVGDGYGGLEHRASTSLLCRRNDLPLAGNQDVEDAYRTFLGLCSHEYFHLWNVKRIKPAAFVPYDLLNENHTRQLWAFEGITAYYDDLALIRSGVIPVQDYLELLGQTVTRVLRNPGRFRQSVAESSFDAWTRFYKQDESAPNTIVSYYAKGSLLALALDLTLRQASNQQRSLDDLMHRLWQDYGQTGRGLIEGEIETLASELCGRDLGDFFDRYLHGTDDLPLEPLLASVGIAYHLRPARTMDDKGGKAADPNDHNPVIGLGASVVDDPAGARLSQVFDNGTAQQAGLSADDVIVALDGLKTDKTDLEQRIHTYPPDHPVRLHYFRRDELYETTLTLQPAPLDTCVLIPDPEATPQAAQARTRWLGQ
jgi:predicted metalloprotease with PDZ domain